MNTRSLSPDEHRRNTNKKTILCGLEREEREYTPPQGLKNTVYIVSNLSKNESCPVSFDILRPNRGLNALTERVSGLDIIELLIDGADLNKTDNKAFYFVPDLELELKTLFNDLLTTSHNSINAFNRLRGTPHRKCVWGSGHVDYYTPSFEMLDARFTREYDGKEYKFIIFYGDMNFMRVSKVLYKRKDAKGYIKKHYITLDFINVEEFKEFMAPFTPSPLYFMDLIPVKNMKKPYYIRRRVYDRILKEIIYAYG